MPSFCNIEDLTTESDVEQKLIMPIITSSEPMGLGYSSSDYYTKIDIKKITIDKGKKKKIYYPDYILTIQGLPFIIIEAKKPGEDLTEALREGRLYAHVINSSFEANINPCKYIIVSNGDRVICGSWDTDDISDNMTFDQLNSTCEVYSKFIKKYSKKTLSSYYQGITEKIRGKRVFSRPTSIIGGPSVRKEKIPANDFGSNLTFEYRSLFNPQTSEERARVVKNVYISSDNIRKHIAPINKIILAANPPSVSDAKIIKSTLNPKEIFKKFRYKNELKRQLLILIGNVGSGKSTFVDYLKEVALPESVRNETKWIIVNLNDAPQSKEEIYKWIMKGIIKDIEETNDDVVFTDLETLKKIYSVEILRHEKITAQIYDESTSEYKKEIGKKILELTSDINISSKAYIRYFCAQNNILPVIVLDNCDRRSREDQLLMFDVAKWAKEEFASLVFLPMRDVTYDNHKMEPPLDTVIKDLVFRIDPPNLPDVLRRRIDYALENGNDRLTYTLSNGAVVAYKRKEQKIYLDCLLNSLFENTFFKRIINGLAGRDIRRGIEIFLDFCKSGHISEDEIFSIRTSKGNFTLPGHLIIRILLRGDRRFYGDDTSYIRNLFTSYPDEEIIPDPFIRISILQWLEKRFQNRGPNQTKGYHKSIDLVKDLITMGHSEDRIIREIGALVKSRCITTESQSQEESDLGVSIDVNLGNKILKNNELLCLAPAGHVHLDLLSSLVYLSSCSEDVWYDNVQTAQKIADRITSKDEPGHLSLLSNVNNAKDLVDYLDKYRNNFFAQPEIYLETGKFDEFVNLKKCNSVIEKTISSNKFLSNIVELKKSLAPGTAVNGKVISLYGNGAVLDLGDGVAGFIHAASFSHDAKDGLIFKSVELHQIINVRIIDFNEKHSKFVVELVVDE